MESGDEEIRDDKESSSETEDKSTKRVTRNNKLKKVDMLKGKRMKSRKYK